MKKLTRVLSVLLLLLSVAVTIIWFQRPEDISFDELRATVPHVEYSHFAEVDGLRAHYQEKGSGPVLLLIHGYAASTYTWKDVFEPLSQHFRVIAVDLKGFGFTSKPEGDYSRPAQAEFLAHFLDTLKVDKATLAGNSMGGEVALNFALNYPQRVDKLILVDSAGVKVNFGSLSPAFAQWPFVGPALTAVALTSDKLVRGGLEKSFTDPSKISAAEVAYYHRPLQTVGGQRAAYLARRQAADFPVEDRIPTIKTPTLILWGAEDRLIPVEAGRKLNALINGSRLVVYERCGHIPQEEMPEKVIRDIVGFAAAPAK